MDKNAMQALEARSACKEPLLRFADGLKGLVYAISTMLRLCVADRPYIEALWIIVSALFIQSKLPGRVHRRVLLRIFGASIGKRVALKPGVRVTVFPGSFL